MEDDKTLEIAATLEDLTEIVKKLVAFSRDLMEQFSETGLLTVESKKDFDNLVFESENCLKEADAILDANERPM